MKPAHPALFIHAARAVWVVLSFAWLQAAALPGAVNPKLLPPQAGVSIEIERMKVPATAKLTNDTDRELAIFYGSRMFHLKPGASKSVPVPKPQMFDLRIFETLEKRRLRERFRGKATPDDPKRVIPLTFEKPKKP